MAIGPMDIIFWTAAAIVVYVYVGYPLLLVAWSRFAPREVRAAPELPAVSVIVASREDGSRLRARIRNLRSLDYPPSRMQIVVVSDGADEATHEALAPYRDVDAVFLPPGGKARALNAGVEASRHPVLVFADVRQRFATDALRALVAPLADPEVGGVCGELVLDCEDRTGPSAGIGEGIGGYWKYEKWLRRHESLIGSTVGATGAIYALRRSLWRPLPAETILDDVLAPMRAVMAASRMVFAPDARAFDAAVPARAELRRKIRTLAGNYQILWQEPRLLNPFANPVWIQYVSHKVGRLLVPYALAATLVSSAALVTTAPIYALAFAAQVAFYALAIYGAYLDRRDERRAGTVLPSPGTPEPVAMKGARR
jgi:cellulose synthase/poly-beta-1,6-N-acetylglucosamine synthase-like glycosyltransferase